MRIRKAKRGDGSKIAEVHVASWKSAYRGIVPDDALDGLKPSQRRAMWQRVIADADDGQLLFVAERDGAIVGFVAGGPIMESIGDFDAELYAIYILDSAQGRGLGRRLVSRLATALRAGGYQSLVLWVLEDNKAAGFYERLGGVHVKDGIYTLGDTTYATRAYGWPDIQSLILAAE